MDAISYTAARTNLAKTMDKVCEDRSPIIITRSKSQSVRRQLSCHPNCRRTAIRGDDLA